MTYRYNKEASARESRGARAVRVVVCVRTRGNAPLITWAESGAARLNDLRGQFGGLFLTAKHDILVWENRHRRSVPL